MPDLPSTSLHSINVFGLALVTQPTIVTMTQQLKQYWCKFTQSVLAFQSSHLRGFNKLHLN